MDTKKEERRKEIRRDCRKTIWLMLFLILLTTGYLGMPASLQEWLVRYAQSIAAAFAGAEIQYRLALAKEEIRLLDAGAGFWRNH